MSRVLPSRVRALAKLYRRPLTRLATAGATARAADCQDHDPGVSAQLMKPFAQHPPVHLRHPPTNLVFDAELRELLQTAIQPATLAAYTDPLSNRSHHMHVLSIC